MAKKKRKSEKKMQEETPQDEVLDDVQDGGNGGDGETPEPHDDDDGPSELRRMMSGYFMEYASYVIKERAIPSLDDGMKPVQRRILWTLHKMDDGKLHKVANVVGNTMPYHPHGDASIYDALVHIANKDFLIDRQGNFGNIYTGDPASAARYIECRLSEMAREVLFNNELTDFVKTYDGRKDEPVALPAKVPTLLMQGAEGIAVGMSTKVMPHNFNELLDAQIDILRKKAIQIYPDFRQGGIMDVSEYDEGRGKIKVRAKIETPNDKTLIIREIPPTTDTESLMQSIENANNKGKVKLSSINDYTADAVEIELKLARGIYADDTIKALYAFTDCEVSISCNCLVIKDNQPIKMSVHDVLKYNTLKLREDLKKELENELGRLEDQYHFKSLAQIFIENRIYKRIEKSKTMDSIKKEVRKGLEPHLKELKLPKSARLPDDKRDVRDVSDADVDKLLQIPIRRISMFDIQRNQDELKDIITACEEVIKNLKSITRYTVRYIKDLKKKYGKEHQRRTKIDEIKDINVREIALKTEKVGIDRGNGYIGTKVKSDTQIDCTEFDRLVIIKWDGTMTVVPVPEKHYAGSVCAVYKANKDHIYSMVYRHRKNRKCYAKRFQVSSYIMNKEYPLVPKGCKVEKIFDRYGVVLSCELKPTQGLRKKKVELKFDEIDIRRHTARGFKICDNEIEKFIQIKRGTDPNTGVGDDDD